MARSIRGGSGRSGVLALIPARAGSKGVPHKNIRMLGGEPLLAWSIAACLKAETLGRVMVSTDSPAYATLALECGAQAPFLRPETLADDRASDLGFVLHALDWLKAFDEEPDYVVHIRPTTPLRDPGIIDAAVRAFVRTPLATALRSVHQMGESAYKTFEMSAEGRLKPVGSVGTALDVANEARQRFPVTYQANGYVDVLSTRFIREAGQLHGDAVLGFVTPFVTEVDTEDDFAFLEFQLARSPQLFARVFS